MLLFNFMLFTDAQTTSNKFKNTFPIIIILTYNLQIVFLQYSMVDLF